MHVLRGLVARCLSAELIVVAAAVAVGATAERFLPPAVAVVAAFGLLRALDSILGATPKRERRSPWHTATPFVVLMAVTLGVTSLITAYPAITMPQVLRVLTGIALYYAIIRWADDANHPSRLRTLTNALNLVLIGLAVAAPFIVEWRGSKFPIIPESVYASFRLMVSDGVNPNVLAGALIVLIPLPLAVVAFRAVEAGCSRETVIAVVALATGFIMLLLMQSRGAWLACACAVAALVAMRWQRMALGLAVAGTVGCAYLVLNPAVASGLVEALSNTGTVAGLDNRLEIWSRAVYMIQDFMFTGIGMGSFEQVTEMLYPLLITPPGVPHAHNLFLQVAVDLGLPGLIAWLGVLATAVAWAWRAYRSPLPCLRALGAGLLAGQVALVVHGMTDAVTWGMVRSAPLVWALWGTAVAAGLVARCHAAVGAARSTQAAGDVELVDRDK